MNSNYYQKPHHGCGGCGGCKGCSGSFHNKSNFPQFIPPVGPINCTDLGPFRAIDAACIVPPANTGSIIPFSSGVTTALLTSIAGGLVGTASLVGFGTAIPGVSVAGNTIDLSGVITEAFSVPRAGNITAISASFTTLLGLALVGTTVTINAQVFRAPAGSNVFTATGASVDLIPPLTGTVAIGDTSSATASLAPIPVAAGDRLLMVFTISASGLDLVQTVTGTASAGITIS